MDFADPSILTATKPTILLENVASSGADLMVMGTHGRGRHRPFVWEACRNPSSGRSGVLCWSCVGASSQTRTARNGTHSAKRSRRVAIDAISCPSSEQTGGKSASVHFGKQTGFVNAKCEPKPTAALRHRAEPPA